MRTELDATGRRLFGHLISWQAGRPERTVLLGLLGVFTILLLVLALAPSSFLLQAAGRSGSGAAGGLAGRLLSHNHLVFGGAAIGLSVVTLLLPGIFDLLLGIVDWIARLDRRAFLGALIVATVVSRLLLVSRMPPIIPNQDPGHYLQLAHTLLQEGRYIEYASHPGEPDGYRAWRPPGYPAALSVALLVTGKRLVAIPALNALWMVVLILAIYGLARRLASEREARLATLAVALYPTLLAVSLRAQNELQFAALVALACYLLFAAPRPAVGALAGGAVLGLAALTRGNGLLMLPGMLIAYPLFVGRVGSESPVRTERGRRKALQTLAVLLGFALAVGPWVLRNRVVLEEWIPVATSGGVNMWWGHHPGATGAFPKPGPPMPEGLNEVERARFGTRAALDYWAEDPLGNLRIGANAVFVTLKVDGGAVDVIDPTFERGTSRPSGVRVSLLLFFNLIYWTCWLAVLVWGIASALDRWPKYSRPGLFVFVTLLYLATFIPFFGWQRFKIPALPFLAAIAGIVFAALAAPRRAPVAKEISRP